LTTTGKTVSLDDLKSDKRSRSSGICPGCGNGKTEATVLLQVRGKKEDKKQEHIKSHSKNLCVECVVSTFKELCDLLDERAERAIA
jgi:hypothetical protein